MRLSIDTKQDSHEDIRKVIQILRHIVGDQEIISNTSSNPVNEINPNAFDNILWHQTEQAAQETLKSEEKTAKEEKTESNESTEDLFAELFSGDELKKMNIAKEEDENPKDKRHKIEFY